MDPRPDHVNTPWTQPKFITATLVIALVAVAGLYLGITELTQDTNTTAQNTTTTTSTSTGTSTTDADTDASICGLTGVETGEATLTRAPDVTWKYLDLAAYPASDVYGPGATDTTGYTYCFQHTPRGALTAAANILVISSANDMDLYKSWFKYVIAANEYRSDLMDQFYSQDFSEITLNTNRVEIVGFKLLSYSENFATIDIACRITSTKTTGLASVAYKLKWDGGDWKINSNSNNADELTSMVSLESLAGYIPWGPS